MGAEGRVKHAQTWEWGPPLEPVEILISSRGTSKETALCLNVTTLVWEKYVHCPLALQAEHIGQYLQCHVCLYAAMSSSKKCIEIFGSQRLNPGCDIQWSINNWPCLVYSVALFGPNCQSECHSKYNTHIQELLTVHGPKDKIQTHDCQAQNTSIKKILRINNSISREETQIHDCKSQKRQSIWTNWSKPVIGKFTTVSQPIDSGWLVVSSGSIDLTLFDTCISFQGCLELPESYWF